MAAWKQNHPSTNPLKCTKAVRVDYTTASEKRKEAQRYEDNKKRCPIAGAALDICNTGHIDGVGGPVHRDHQDKYLKGGIYL